MSNILVFGSSGTLGTAISNYLELTGNAVTLASRHANTNSHVNVSDPDWASNLAGKTKFDGIVWAQGINGSGSVLETTDMQLESMLEANVLFIAKTLRLLHEQGLLSKPARGVVISSIWQELARANKFAYLVSKSALAGLVRSIAIDMAEYSFSINAVLPGVIDTPMTRANLSEEQITNIEINSAGGTLATPLDVARAVSFLLGRESQGQTGQFLTVDNGWSVRRHV